jgi:hypothetical protein
MAGLDNLDFVLAPKAETASENETAANGFVALKNSNQPSGFAAEQEAAIGLPHRHENKRGGYCRRIEPPDDIGQSPDPGCLGLAQRACFRG